MITYTDVVNDTLEWFEGHPERLDGIDGASSRIKTLARRLDFENGYLDIGSSPNEAPAASQEPVAVRSEVI